MVGFKDGIISDAKYSVDRLLSTAATNPGDLATVAVGTVDQIMASGVHAWNCNIIETPSVSITSDGAVITASVEKLGGGNLTLIFESGFSTWNTTPADTTTLTAGTDAIPVLNYVYYNESTLTFESSTSSFPANEYAPIALIVCQSAATLQTDEPIMVFLWTDHIQSANNQGHISHLNFWIRKQKATWSNGVSQTYTITTNGGGLDNVILTTASGNVLQLHDHVFPAFSGTPTIYIVNDSVTPYTKVTDLNTQLNDSTGASMSGRYFTLVIWGIVSQDGSQCKIFCNLPSGSYNSESSLSSDVSKFADFSIPNDYTGAAFLISQWNLRHQTTGNGTWTSIDEIDLRGLQPSVSPGGTTAFPNEFQDSVFRIIDDVDATKKVAFEASGITTGTVRIITMADEDIDLTPDGTFQETISGAVLTGATVATNDEVLIQDVSDSNSLKKVDVQSILDLGGGSSPQIAHLTSDQTVNNSTTLVDATGISIDLITGTYHLDGVVFVSGDASGDFDMTLSASGGTFTSNGWNYSTDGSPSIQAIPLDTQNKANMSGTIKLAPFTGTIAVTAGTTTVKVRWAQQAAHASNTVMYTDSFLRATKID
jgi:hypothetical protein